MLRQLAFWRVDENQPSANRKKRLIFEFLATFIFRQFVFKMFINSKCFSFFCKRLCVCNNSPQPRSKRYFAKHIISVHHSNENKEVELQVLDKNDFLMFSIDFSKKGNADFTKKNLKKTIKKIVKLLKKSNVQKNVPPPKNILPPPLVTYERIFSAPHRQEMKIIKTK